MAPVVGGWGYSWRPEATLERNEVSVHEARVYVMVKSHEGWVSCNELIEKLKGVVAPRTVRAHMTKFQNLNLLDVAEVFPGHRYRWAKKADKRNNGYLKRLDMAVEVFGLDKKEGVDGAV